MREDDGEFGEPWTRGHKSWDQRQSVVIAALWSQQSAEELTGRIGPQDQGDRRSLDLWISV